MLNIILVITDSKGKNILFVLDNLRALTLAEAIKETTKGEISGVHIVKAKKGRYIRANPNAIIKDNLDAISISQAALTGTLQSEASVAVRRYHQKRQQLLAEKEAQGEKIIYIDGVRKKTEQEAASYLAKHRSDIFSAAKDLKVDAHLLGAILIDEDLRRDWIDDWSDWLAILGQDRSVGIAQIKVSTAKDLIKRGFYPADPTNKNISLQNVDRISAKDLHNYLNNPKHSIYFAAAKINQIKKNFSSRYDLSQQEIIADLYSRKSLKSTGGKVTKRGYQIANQFYEIAKKALAR